MSAPEVRPKDSKATLEPMANTIAVANGLLFDYYPIKLGEQKGLFRSILKSPPLIVEGFVTVGKQLYFVSTRDYLRRRVNVARAITTSSLPSNPVVGERVQTRDQSGPIQGLESAIDEEANLAWTEQINSLLHLDDPQEEWFPEDFTQS